VLLFAIQALSTARIAWLILQEINVKFILINYEYALWRTFGRRVDCLVKAGDHAAFNSIYDRYWKFLLQAVYQVSRNRADSLDICQTVFFWFWENLLL
jgi:hypothetical protein